jgi:hypothetical protein
MIGIQLNKIMLIQGQVNDLNTCFESDVKTNL